MVAFTDTRCPNLYTPGPLLHNVHIHATLLCLINQDMDDLS